MELLKYDKTTVIMLSKAKQSKAKQSKAIIISFRQ